MPDRERRAAALRYEGVGAPSVAAAGRGRVAEQILAAARAAGVAVCEDPLLAEAPATLGLGAEVPPELCQAVAEALVWAYRIGGSSSVIACR